MLKSRMKIAKFLYLLCLVSLALDTVNGSLISEDKKKHIHVVDKDSAHGRKHIHVVDKDSPHGRKHIHVVDKDSPHGRKHIHVVDKHGHGGSKNDAEMYEIKTRKMHAKFTNWGATLISLYLPDKHGQMGDVVLGYNSVDEYKNDTTYFGATIGRVANRISGAQFSIGDHHYTLKPNEGDNMLHGGLHGFSNVAWRVERHDKDGRTPSITFAYHSPDGDEGFPGGLDVKTTYTLDDDENTMTIEMTAKHLDDKDTPVNMANHVYWNLGGHDSGDVLGHRVQIFGSHITPVDSHLIPKGTFTDIKGTSYDFLEPRAISSRVDALPDGYDINYSLDSVDGHGKRLHRAAVVEDSKSGRKIELLSNQYGMQFYTGGKLKEVKGKNGAVYGKFGGVCLETQGFPDAVNQKHFPDQILGAGEEYKHTMLFKFSTAFSERAVA